MCGVWNVVARVTVDVNVDVSWCIVVVYCSRLNFQVSRRRPVKFG